MLKNLYDRLRLLRRGDWQAIAFALVLIIAIGWAALAGSGFHRGISNFGFGLDWNCTSVGNGEPVCIKQPAKPAAR
jgi:hypothetical protein